MLLDATRSSQSFRFRARLTPTRKRVSVPRLSSALIDLFARLDRRPDTPPLADLADWLARSPIGVDDLTSFLSFDDDRYSRNLVRATDRWQVLLLCWRRGQYSPIHDHNGSVCAFKVLRGSALELLYEPTPTGRARFTSSHELPPTGVSAQEDADIHRVIAVEELVTLHIYAPPLVAMQTYDEE
jgi:cysteine dioxygenase